MPFNGAPPTPSAAVESLPERRQEPPPVVEQVVAATERPPVRKPQPPPPAPKRTVPAWILQVRKLDLVELAEVLGLEVEGERLQPCPCCGDEDGAEVFTTKKGLVLWRCGACEVKDRGNLDLASYAIAGERAGDLEPERKALLQQWFADQGWCEGDDTTDNG